MWSTRSWPAYGLALICAVIAAYMSFGMYYVQDSMESLGRERDAAGSAARTATLAGGGHHAEASNVLYELWQHQPDEPWTRYAAESYWITLIRAPGRDPVLIPDDERFREYLLGCLNVLSAEGWVTSATLPLEYLELAVSRVYGADSAQTAQAVLRFARGQYLLGHYREAGRAYVRLQEEYPKSGAAADLTLAERLMALRYRNRWAHGIEEFTKAGGPFVRPHSWPEMHANLEALLTLSLMGRCDQAAEMAAMIERVSRSEPHRPGFPNDYVQVVETYLLDWRRRCDGSNGVRKTEGSTGALPDRNEVLLGPIDSNRGP